MKLPKYLKCIISALIAKVRPLLDIRSWTGILGSNNGNRVKTNRTVIQMEARLKNLIKEVRLFADRC